MIQVFDTVIENLHEFYNIKYYLSISFCYSRAYKRIKTQVKKVPDSSLNL